MSTLKQSIPWWLRISAKIVLSRLPVSYSFWKHLHLFEHGDMNLPDSAINNLLMHAHVCGVLDAKSNPPHFSKNDRFNVLEIGPGDSLFTAVIAHTLGATQTWLVDAGPFATKNISAYINLFDALRKRGFPAPYVEAIETYEDILQICNAKYLFDGVSSLAKIPSSSIDFCFSNAVLEHIPRHDFEELAKELFRILSPKGVSFHRVDLKDHLGGKLNNLRFSEAIWEGGLFSKSGFYTNRLRFREVIETLECAGFLCDIPRVNRWDSLPTRREKMDLQFRMIPDEELLISGFDIILRRKGVI